MTHRLQRQIRLLLGATACLAALGPAAAHAAAFSPSGPVTIVVPYSAGGGTDAVGRLFARKLHELWQQPVLVENRTGASGSIGAAAVAKAPADGHHLLLAVASLAINPYVVPNLPFDTARDFTPITSLARPVVVMVGAPALQAHDIRSFIELARQHPGKHTFASSEPATQLYGERLAHLANVELVHVPYRGAGQWMTDVMGNTVDTGFSSITSAQAAMREGRLKVLGIVSEQRNPLLPDTPTFEEQGLADFESKSWYGLFAPKGTSPDIVQAIHADILQVAATPEVRELLTALGAGPGGEPPEAFAQRFLDDLEYYGEMTRQVGIRIN